MIVRRTKIFLTEVFEQRKERKGRQIPRHNDANMIAESFCNDIRDMTSEAVSRKKRVEESTVVPHRS